jgi:ribosomal protein S18 acetylase RimI-like enzyme
VIRDALVASGIDAWGGFLDEDLIARAVGREQPADLVAEDEDGVFGFVAWDAGTGEITRLYVHPRAQGRGAGAALLDRALGELRAAGLRTAWLNTEERNHGARRFYERLGWVEEGRPRVRDWHGVRLVEPRYAKRL